MERHKRNFIRLEVIDMIFNYQRFAELMGYFEDKDVNYSELQEIRDKLTDLKTLVEDEMEKY